MNILNNTVALLKNAIIRADIANSDNIKSPKRSFFAMRIL